MLEKLEKEMNLTDELLNNLPVNNRKNKEKFLEEISLEINDYKKKLDATKKDLLRKLDKFEELSYEENKDYTDSLNTIIKAIFYTNNLSTPYEKLSLDKLIYQLSFYKQDKLINNNLKILKIVKIFDKVSPLTIENFNYSADSKTYMQMFFESNLTESKVKKTFDDIYWKCPDLIPQIVLSFRHLYIKNIQKFEKYIEGINSQIKDNFVRGEKSLLDDYNHLIGRKESFISKNNIILDFYNQNKDIDEYTDEKVDEIINRLYTGETRDNIIETIKRLYYSLIEYKNYLKYKDLIDKAKKLYGETLEKDYLKNTLKKINKLEQELFKLNKKSSNKVTKTSVDKLEPAINSKIGEIKALYDEIDEKLFLIIIKTYIKDNSTIFKVLLLICQHYKVLADYFLEGDPNLSYSQIDSKIDELISFTLSPNNTLINNITLLEKQELSDIIVTNYKLLNINVEESFSSPEALDSLIGDLEKILINDKMKLLKINVEDLKDAKAIKALEL